MEAAHNRGAKNEQRGVYDNKKENDGVVTRGRTARAPGKKLHE